MDPLNHVRFIFVAANARHLQCVGRLSQLTFQEQVAVLSVPSQLKDERQPHKETHSSKLCGLDPGPPWVDKEDVQMSLDRISQPITR